jgi:regulatory protein YycH of two-component signal transduction system YycFG
MNWLDKKNLLTDAGRNAKIDLQFELDSTLLTPLGNEILSRVYNIWAQQVDYKHRPKPHILDKTYNLLKNKKSKKMPDVIQQQNIAVASTTANNNITKSSTLEQEVYDKLALLYKELAGLI